MYNNVKIMTTQTRIGDCVAVRRKDGKLNATDFLAQYNATAKVKKRIDVFLRSAETKEILELLKDESPCEMQREKQEGCRPMKRVWWFSPTLFAKFVMWLDARLAIILVKWFVDNTFDNTPEGVYMKCVETLKIGADAEKCERIIKGLDFIVFGKHEPNMWIAATDEQRMELYDIQTKYMFDIGVGLMGFDDYIKELQKLYLNKQKQIENEND